MDIFLQQILNGLVLGSVYALVALGYTMVYGILGLINFAHGEVVMVGALVSLSVIELLMGTNLGIPAPVVGTLALIAAIRASVPTTGAGIPRLVPISSSITDSETRAPTITTSPWAKLIKPSMP